jgi:hypothetical protein
MNITINSSNTFSITPADNYLPAGAYIIYAYVNDIGFATVTNSTYLIQSFTSNVTCNSISSSLNGGKRLVISGIGFVEDIANNHIFVCGLESKVLSSNRTSISIEVPPLVSAWTI